MTSTLTLYYGTLLKQARNFLLDVNGAKGIETYLQTISQKSVINNFQYIKQALNITIKIDMSQTGLNMGSGSQDLNYVKIQNGNENPCYYFVVSKTWKAQGTIELELAMDTLNTYRFNNDYNLSEKTLVKREHKNRFTQQYTIMTRNCVFKIIDLKSEEISAPLFRNENDDKILNDGLGEIGLNWSLYYKNADNQDESPIDCYLVPENPITINYQSSLGEITTSDIPNGYHIMFFIDYNSPNITIDVDGSTYSPEYYGAPLFVETYIAIAIKNDNGVLKVFTCKYANGYVAEVTQVSSNPNYIKIQNAPSSVRCLEIQYLPPTDLVFGVHLYEYGEANKTLNFGSLTTGVLNGVASINKTLAENVKIINLPYSPTEVTLYNAIYTLDACWKYDVADRRAKLQDFNKRFENDIQTNVTDIYNKFYVETYSWTGRNGTAKRFLKDPKLLHSDFYRPKFVYDSFTKVFPLEELDDSFDIMKERRQRYMTFKFVMSRNIVSKFLFQFDYIWKNTTEDYPNVVAVSRNNEEVLYNSQYLDYIRTGYNYDLKSKERQQQASGIGIGLNVAGLLASIGLSFVPGGQTLGIGGAIAGGIGLVSQLVGYAKQTAQAEENIQRKLVETQRQSNSVMNADDYDLLYAYSLNKPKMCYYSVSSQMENILDDLFYYCGYICNEQKVPNVYSRYWFNFVQAELEVSHTNNLTGDILDDIKEKFNSGVTFLHYHHNKYDFKQEMENFEIYLIQ